jgi:hypothetical protein
MQASAGTFPRPVHWSAKTITERTAPELAAKALRLLSEEGVLARHPGFGYYVTGPKPD